jgi:hypothetical protein
MGNRTIESRFIREISGVTQQHKQMAPDPWDVPDPIPSETEEVTVGVVVRHKRFGVGKVQRVIRRSRGSTITIQFRSGVKHLVLEYANLEIVPPDNSPEF